MTLDLGELIPVLAAAYGVMLGVVALVEGWHLVRGRRPGRRRRGVVVPPAGVTAPIGDAAPDGDGEDPRRARGGVTGWSTAGPPWRTW